MNTRDISDDHVPSGPSLLPGLEDYVHIAINVRPPPPPPGIEYYVYVPVRPVLSSTPHPPTPGFAAACGHWAPYYRGEANSCEYFNFNHYHREPTWWSKAPRRTKSPKDNSLKALDDCQINKDPPTQRELDTMALLMQDSEFSHPPGPVKAYVLHTPSAWLEQKSEPVVQRDYKIKNVESSELSSSSAWLGQEPDQVVHLDHDNEPQVGSVAYWNKRYDEALLEYNRKGPYS